MYDLNYCLVCALPFEPVKRIADVSGIGDEGPEWVVFIEDDLCQCGTEDDYD
jgi:hypothetical protein